MVESLGKGRLVALQSLDISSVEPQGEQGEAKQQQHSCSQSVGEHYLLFASRIDNCHLRELRFLLHGEFHAVCFHLLYGERVVGELHHHILVKFVFQFRLSLYLQQLLFSHLKFEQGIVAL